MLLSTLAQSSYDYSYTTTDLNTAEKTGLLAVFGAFFVVWLVLALVMIVSMWKIFEKAGKPGWAALIPVYNTWVLAEVSGKPGWLALVFLVAWIPVLGPLAALAASILINIGLAKAFGKDPVWALLLILLPIVGYPMLAFGKDKYTKPAKVSLT